MCGAEWFELYSELLEEDFDKDIEVSAWTAGRVRARFANLFYFTKS